MANIAHRDIKPENLKLNGKEKDVVLYDFGASNCFDDDDDLISDTAGTYAFFAPEIVTRTKGCPKIMHGKRCDVWAAGVTLFMVATGQHPFDSLLGSIPHLIDSISNNEVDYSTLDDSLFVAFLQKMLTKDQEKRSTILDLVEDPYLTKRGMQPLDLFHDISDDSDDLTTDTDEMSEVPSEEEMTP
jgi:[calcium/calmodulin-dependent protein kinase] kinase